MLDGDPSAEEPTEDARPAATSGGLAVKLVLAGVTTILALGLAEGALRLSARAPRGRPDLEPDSILGFRVVPRTGGHDDWGFRNESVPERARTVVLGDSQTYGFYLDDDEPYPVRLAERTSSDVYNMGHGGYGPIQYLTLVEQALALQPEVVVIGLYLGNDLSDAYRYAGLEHWEELRAPGVQYPDTNETMELRHAARAASRNGPRPFVERSVLAQYLRLLWARVEPEQSPEVLLNWQHRVGEGAIETIVAPRYRKPVVDLERPSIRDGLRITERVLEEIQSSCSAAGARCVLLLIHTKEYSYYRLMERDSEPMPQMLASYGETERDARDAIVEAAARVGIEVIDPIDDLVDAMARGEGVWRSNADGHLDARGADVIAEVLAREIGPDASSP